MWVDTIQRKPAAIGAVVAILAVAVVVLASALLLERSRSTTDQFNEGTTVPIVQRADTLLDRKAPRVLVDNGLNRVDALTLLGHRTS